MNKAFFIELVKYGIVGVMNTLITAVVIWLMMNLVFAAQGDTTISISVSNFIGYVAGVINSFVWNKNWTFKSKKSWKKEFLVFIGMFFICYIPQLILVYILNTRADFSSFEFTLWGISISHAYICQLIGIVFFTVLNFLCNKYFTFRKKTSDL